jgi:anti-sigma regulatory factor (Ser/Thr protein kinase)
MQVGMRAFPILRPEPALAEATTASVDLLLPGHPESISRARRALDVLADRVSGELLDDLRLLVSELVTSAASHAGAGVGEALRLRVVEQPGHVRVELVDRGPGFRAPVAGPAGGWGLWLVQEIADRWGIRGGRETCIWFEIADR